jgi:hypothetical protein
MIYARPVWKIELKTGDHKPPYPEWIELHGYGKRYQYVERELAEKDLARLQRIQPHAQLRIAPL